MRELVFSARLSDGRDICVAPLSRDTFENNKAFSLGDDYGYFIYEIDSRAPQSGIEILGKAVSYDAAIRLIDIFLGAGRSLSPST
jgi:hypothetical protein